MQNEIIENVKNYYGQTLDSSDDLKTSACCVEEEIPSYLKPILKDIHGEVMTKFYGCGSPIPLELEGRTVLDLGSGSGRDSFVMSKLVGPNGRVIGVDMTDEQLQVAEKHVTYHTEKFGYTKPNVEFRKAYIEDLRTANIADNSIDVITSNCVLNLSTNKEKVFSEIFRVLKPGGELYFSDVFSDRRIPEELTKDPVLHGECLSGALYKEDFRRLLGKIGCADVRVDKERILEVTDPDIHRKIGMITFYSMTVRAFKLELEDQCEDYGQVAYYQGSIAGNSHEFALDDHHVFKTNQPTLVCSNTARMLTQTRYQKHFKVVGDESTHFGLFACNTDSQSPDETTTGCC